MGNFSNAIFTDAVMLALIGAIAPTLASLAALIVTLRGKKETRHMKNALINAAESIGGDRDTLKARMYRRRKTDPVSDEQFLKRKPPS